MLRRAFVVFTIAATLAAPALAQETMRVRGAIERIDGSTLYVKTRDGADLKIALADKPVFTAIIPATLADLKPGTYVGSAAVPGPDGSLSAVEVHIFPEAMRGTGEGHRPWDGGAQATMTNANVETAVAGVDGQTLTLKYKDGEKKLLVTPQTAIVSFAPGDRAEVKAGTKIFIAAAQKQADGSLVAARISYGRDGLTPPM
jgi:outer membrane lipoprotein SlyB